MVVADGLDGYARVGGELADGDHVLWSPFDQLAEGASARMLPSSHAATSASIVRPAFADTVVRDEKLARISVECLERHPSRREQVLANGCKAPRWNRERAAREPREDPLLHVVERFVGYSLLKLA